MKKAGTIFILYIIIISRTLACNVCKEKQPDLLKNITHGTGPQSNMDYIIIWCSLLIVAIVFLLSMKYLIKPQEIKREHIKKSILN